MQVHRRLVIHVQGYDPRSLAENFEHFNREYRRTCDLYGLTGEVGTADEMNSHSGAWQATTHGDGWQVETRYRLLRWDDLVRDFRSLGCEPVAVHSADLGETLGAFLRWADLRQMWRGAVA